MNEFVKIDFKIQRIFAGWFDIVLEWKDKKVKITDSDAWDNDSPKCLLEVLAELRKEAVCNRYIIFNADPGSYIVSFDQDVDLILSVCRTDIPIEEWQKLHLNKHLSFDELKDYISHRGESETLFRVRLDLEDFICKVCDAFGRYREGTAREEYEKNWMQYPEEALKNLL